MSASNRTKFATFAFGQHAAVGNAEQRRGNRCQLRRGLLQSEDVLLAPPDVEEGGGVADVAQEVHVDAPGRETDEEAVVGDQAGHLGLVGRRRVRPPLAADLDRFVALVERLEDVKDAATLMPLPGGAAV